MKENTMKNPRGLYQRDLGKHTPWWIRYADCAGKIRREKVGLKSDAKTLLDKRKTEVLQRIKLPENFRKAPVTFAVLCTDALSHVEAANCERSPYELRLKINEMLPAFGNRLAEDIRKQDIEAFLGREAKTRGWKPATQDKWQSAFSLIFRVGLNNEKID